MLKDINEALKKNNREHSVNIQSVQRRIRDLEDSREKDRNQSSPIVGTAYAPILKRVEDKAKFNDSPMFCFNDIILI